MKHLALASAIGMALALTACADLPDVPADGCGNLVLNEDEDCDGHTNTELGESLQCGEPATVHACRYVCDPANGVTCPTGWGCGTDGRCRRPSGTFEEAPGSPWRFQADDFIIGDVDGDGNADLVGNNLSTITVRYGSPTGEFPIETNLLTRRPEGPLAFDHFNDDDRLDIVVPIDGGLFVLLGQADRSLEPVAYSPFELDDSTVTTKLHILPVESFPNLNTELVMIANNFMAFLDNLEESAVVGLPGGYNANQLQGKVAVGNLHWDSRNGWDVAGPLAKERNEFALAFRDANQVWIYTSTGSPEREDQLATIRVVQHDVVGLPLGAKIDKGAQLADVNGDGFLDLMVSIVDGNGGERIAVAYNNGFGDLDLVANILDRFDRSPGKAAWPLAAGDLNGDYKADYVFSEAVVIADIYNPTIGPPNSLDPTAFFAEYWSEAIIVDVNGDGKPDVAGAVSGVDGINVLLGSGIGLFNKFHIDTDEPPRNLRGGDFDGDLIGDVAFVLDGLKTKEDQLAVMFGRYDGGPEAPVKMGRMDTVDVMEPVSMVFGLEGIDVTTDLFVLSSSYPDGDVRSVALMQGSSSRRMLSPFSLVSEAGGITNPDVPRYAVIGNFDGDGVKDIISIAESVPNFSNGDVGGTTASFESHLWMLPGDGGDGSISAADVELITMPDQTIFTMECSSWAIGDLDPDDGSDEVVGIDNNSDCYGFGFSPAPRLMVARATPGEAAPFSATTVNVPGDYRAVRDIMLRDADNDGDRDLVALFTGDFSSDGTGAIEGAAVTVIWNDGGTLDPATMSTVTVSEATEIYDVAVAHIDTDMIPDLLILTDAGVYAAHLDTTTNTYMTPQLKIATGGFGRIDSGDVNGDGLPDVAFTVGDDVMVMLQVEGAPLGAELQSEGDE